jgi:hypothetical protein
MQNLAPAAVSRELVDSRANPTYHRGIRRLPIRKLVTVAPPLPRSHLVPALACTALLSVTLACPVAAKPPEDKGPPAHAHGVGHGADKPGLAKGHAKRASRPARSHGVKPKAVRPAHEPPGQLKKATGVKAKGNPHVGSAAPEVTTPGAASPSAGAARRGGTARAAAAARRRATAARRRAAARRARRSQARRAATAAEFPRPSADGFSSGTTPLGASAPSVPADEPAQQPKERGRPPFRPVTSPEELPPPLRVVRDVVEVVPTPLRVLVAGLVALAVLLAGAYALTLMRNRRLAGQRRELLGEVGLLQAALLPDLPDSLASCRASVAYRPAAGPGAGGDFYDVLALAGGRTAVLIGDVSGHGRAALARTALARYTLRAYVEAGLEPREALQVAGSVLAGKLQGDFVTALVAIHDAAAGTLTYAAAGHPPPIIVSGAPFEPVLKGSAPPLGVGASTGQRQTTLPFPRGAIACFYTDGLSEARCADGQLGTARLERLVRELGPDVTAQQVVRKVAASARTTPDDAAACVIAAEDGTAIVRSRVELLEVSRAELRGPLLREFLDACGVSPQGVRRAEGDARELGRRVGGAIVEVRMGERPEVEVRPPDLAFRDDAGLSGVGRIHSRS